jgi:hypothetical protein
VIARASSASNGWVAQLAEQWTENPRVGGSIPPPATPMKTRPVQQNLAMIEAISSAGRLVGGRIPQPERSR